MLLLYVCVWFQHIELPVGYSIGDELYIISTECSTPYGTKVKVEGALPSGTALRVSLPDSDKIIEHKLKELTKNESDIVTVSTTFKSYKTYMTLDLVHEKVQK